MIDVNRLMSIKSDCDRYRGELRVLAADAGMDSLVGKDIFDAATWLERASQKLKAAVLEASAEEDT